MAYLKYLIAGLKVEMSPQYSLLLNRSKKYRFDFEGEADIVIDLPEDKLQSSREAHPNCSDEIIEYMCTGSYFYYRLLRFDGFMLHSSCIAYNGKAYIFSADSGTGKSTHTSLWQRYVDGVIMINDDKPAVRMINGVFCAIGTPWSGKHDESTDITVPIGGAALLYRGKRNCIRPATGDETVPFFMRQTMFPSKPENTDLMVSIMDKFLRAVPVYHLECDISEEAVKTSFEALTKGKYISKGI